MQDSDAGILPQSWQHELTQEEFQSLCQFCYKLALTHDLHEHLDALLEGMQRVFGFDAAALYLLSEDGRHLVLQSQRGMDSSWAEAPHCLGAKDDLIAEVASTGQIGYRMDNTPAWPTLAAPLLMQGRVFGVLAAQRRELREVKRDEMILRALAIAVAGALYPSYVLAWSQKRVERLSVLNEIARTLSANLQIRELLDVIYEQVSRVIDTSTYFVALFDEEKNILTIEVLIDEGVRFPKEVSIAGEGLAWWIVQHRKPLRLNDLENDLKRFGLAAKLVGHPRPSRSWLGVPMMVGERFIGILAVASYEPGAFSEQDEELLVSVAAQAAIAIENARLYEKTRRQLEELQEAQERMVSMARLAASAELASGLGHEINNALTPILGVTQLALRRDDLDPTLRADLERVFASGQRIRSIVRTFADMLSGLTPTNQTISLNRVLLNALQLFEWQFKENRIAVELHLQEGLSLIMGDASQLEQVMANVLLNALEAMPAGGKLRISSHGDKGKACVEIEDTGKGIPPEDLRRVFEPGFTTKIEAGRARGLGLGLFVAYNVIKAHGGHIELSSTPLVGTVVKICLPAKSS